MYCISSRTLRRWFIRIETELAAAGYEKRQRVLTPKQTEVIYGAFGQP